MNYKHGKAKTAVIRIHNETKSDLNFIRADLRMHKSHNEGDVVERLIQMQRSNIDYKKLYEDQIELTRRWKARCDHICQKHGIESKEIMQIELGKL